MEKEKEKERDAHFLEGIAKGDSLIIRQVYKQYFNSITQYVLNNSGSIDDAKDVFQDAIMVIYEKLQQPDFKLEYGLHTYLFTVARNTWLKKLRKKSDKGVPLPDNLELIAEDSFEEEILWREKERLYREKFAQLGEGCQKVINFFLAGVSMEEIAKRMGFASAGYAKKRKYKCKNQLLKLIQKDQKFQKLI